MKRSPKQEAARWLRQAVEDFRTGDYLAKGERFYFASFVFQQAAEKALKAYLYYQGMHSIIGHSVQKLCQQCAQFDKAFGQILDEVKGLDTYYIPTRYPNGLPDGIPAEVYNFSDAQRTRTMCKKIMKLVKARI